MVFGGVEVPFGVYIYIYVTVIGICVRYIDAIFAISHIFIFNVCIYRLYIIYIFLIYLPI